VLYVLELKNNLLSVSILEDMGFVVTFQKGKVLISLKRASSQTAISIGVREGELYRLLGQHVRGSKGILDHVSMSVTEDEEQEALKGKQPKDEQSSQTSSVGSKPLEGKRQLAPSNPVRRSSWYEMTLMDAQEQEASRSTLRERKPSTKVSNFVALICSVINFETSSIQGVTNHQGWRNANMQDDVCDIVPESEV
jgi:hypothetical protein